MIDHTGQRFGRLTVRYLAPRDQWRSRNALWWCVCDCGKERAVPGDALRSGATTSCGCWSRERSTSHGMCRTSEYMIWKNIKKRCGNRNSKHYVNYGGRGITVCDRWLSSFNSFFADIGPRPGPEYSIDRIDNAKGYSPENCRWATATQQSRNRRNNVFVVFNGRRMCLTEAAEAAGLPIRCIEQRRRRGWPESAWFLPSGSYRLSRS